MIKRLIALYKNRKNPDFHPKHGVKVVFAFEVDGKKYYQLEQVLEMPIERFNFLQTYYHEMQLRITSEKQAEFLDAIKECINTPTGGALRLGDAVRLVDELKDRLSWFAEEETMYRFASVQYFTLDEDLSTYNVAYNQKKIEHWRKKKALFAILGVWSREADKPLNTSTQDLEDYLGKQRELAKNQNQYLERLMGKKP